MTHDEHGGPAPGPAPGPASGSAPGSAPGVPPVPTDGPGPDADNPALIFARKTYLWTIILAIGFVGSVVIFIL